MSASIEQYRNTVKLLGEALVVSVWPEATPESAGMVFRVVLQDFLMEGKAHSTGPELLARVKDAVNQIRQHGPEGKAKLN